MHDIIITMRTWRTCFFLLCAFFVSFLSAAEASTKLPSYDLLVSFDAKRSALKGLASILITEEIHLNISVDGLEIKSVSLNGKPVKPDIRDGMMKLKGGGVLEIAYEAYFGEKHERQGAQNGVASGGNIINEDAILLTDDWYPGIDGPAVYNLKVILPEGLTAVSQVDETVVLKTQNGTEYSFVYRHPAYSLHLVAGRYAEYRTVSNGTEIYAYFRPENKPLAETCIEVSMKYLERFGDIISPYPYKRFSVVENTLPGEHIMPSVLVLGQDSLNSPALIESFIGNAILHQWFGSLVNVESEQGDWSAGLVTCLFNRLMQEGKQHRKDIIAEYENHVRSGNELALKEFTGANNRAEKAIGFGKSAMVFQMLINVIGEEVFFEALREFVKNKAFERASWDDLKIAFKNLSGEDLAWFFDQWTGRKGIPSILPSDTGVVFHNGVPTVKFDLVQEGDPYILDVPVRIKTDKSEFYERVRLEKGRDSFSIPVHGQPLDMTIDENYDLMRRLSDGERPPMLSALFGDDNRLIVVPDAENDYNDYTELSSLLMGEGYSLKRDFEVQDEDIKANSVILLGTENLVLKRLFGSIKNTGPGFEVSVRKNPLNSSKVVVIVEAGSKEQVDLAAKHLPAFGNYSFLRFMDGDIVEKRTAEASEGIQVGLYKPAMVVRPRKALKLDDIISEITDKKIIYVGEKHTSYEDHRVQLRIIMSLHEKGRKFAIGMEMFQTPFQSHINSYLSGAISEKEFLKRTEYFRRWQFDYNLYREIIGYAKANNIPVIALNLWSEIIKKVSTDGIDSLTDIERALLPKSMDMSDDDYRERLREVFGQHRNRENKKFDNFYQSQILWDETMAHSVDDFLRKNPDHQMVVLAGTGHIMYGSGIPKRAFRLNGEEYVTLIPSGESIEEDLADYLYSAEHLPLPAAPKLGVILTEKNRSVHVEKILPGSTAKSLGLKKGDVLVSLDEWDIEDIPDVTIFMADRKRGDTITIKVLRKGFLTGYRELVLTGSI